MGSNHMHDILRNNKIPTHDPQTGELNPYYKELTGETNPLEAHDPLWNELTAKEKENGIPTPPNVIDANEVGLDSLANMLYDKYMFQSSIEALGICQLVEFYRKNK